MKIKPKTRKAIAEVLAGVIPAAMARNRWRGILRYSGPLRALLLRWRFKRDKSTPQYYLAVCAIAKNEGPYFDEWIAWHRKQGVDKFYIYDNESTDDTARILAPYVEQGIVEYNFWPGAEQQLWAYDDCFRRHRLETRWLAVIDLDEFIVPVQDTTVADFLKKHEKSSVVEINWLVYGSSGHKDKLQGGVMERFTQHSLPDNELNRHVKSIVDPRRVLCMTGCHEAARLSGHAVDSHGKRIRKNFRDREPLHDIIKINHYAVKSYEEFLQKRARGRARRTVKRGLGYFDKYDLNDVTE